MRDCLWLVLLAVPVTVSLQLLLALMALDGGSLRVGLETISLARLLREPSVLTDVTRAVAVFLAAHLVMAAAALWLGHLPPAWVQRRPLHFLTRPLVLFVLMAAAVGGLAVHWYPYSQAGQLLQSSDHFELIEALAAGAGLAVTGILGLRLAAFGPRRLGAVAIMLALVGIGFGSRQGLEPPGEAESEATAPNLLIISIDSLRPDQLAAYGHVPGPMQFLDSLLRDFAVVGQASTPLARTFPSWVSLLTGRGPDLSGARENLIDSDEVQKSETLAWALRRAGYHTVYATDETRFSNLDERWGFDQVLGPRQGVMDFLIGSMFDFPLWNVLHVTPLLQPLLPYSSGNRAAAHLYRPEVMDRALRRMIHELPPSRPTMIAAHFCLAHWPFGWAEQAPSHSAESHQSLYRLALQRVDRQIAAYVDDLRRVGLMNRAIVIVMSDHGDTHTLHHDKPRKLVGIDASLVSGGVIPLGHGTHVLSPGQWKTVLAFQRFPEMSFTPGLLSQSGSLIDIWPTVAAQLGQPVPREVEGLDLSPALAGHGTVAPHRIFFMESALSPKALNTASIDKGALVRETIELYRINAEGRLVLRDDATASLLRAKQRAAMRGDEAVMMMLGADGRTPITIHADFANRAWTGIQSSDGPGETAALVKALCSRYALEEPVTTRCAEMNIRVEN